MSIRKLWYASMFVLVACGGQETNTSTPTTPKDKEKTADSTSKKEEVMSKGTTVVKKDSLGIDITTLTQGRKNQYGGGDCMGNISEYTKDDLKIAIDTMDCGDYGITVREFLLKGDKLLMLKVQAAAVDMESTDIIYQFLTEDIYDFRAESFTKYNRKTKSESRDFSSLTADFTKELIPATDSTFIKTSKEYAEIWTYKVEQ